MGLDVNGTHKVLAYVDDLNLIGVDIRIIERNTGVLLNACNDIDLAVNTGETKDMEIGHNRGMVVNEHIRIGTNSYEKVKTFKYLRNVLKRRRECGTYLATARRHRRRLKMQKRDE